MGAPARVPDVAASRAGPSHAGPSHAEPLPPADALSAPAVPFPASSASCGPPRRAARARKRPRRSLSPLSAHAIKTADDDCDAASQLHGAEAALPPPRASQSTMPLPCASRSATPLPPDTPSAALHSPPLPPHGTGPGKRHRRPSTMYRPPEALTAEQRRSPPEPSPPAGRAKGTARHAPKAAPPPPVGIRLTGRLARKDADDAGGDVLDESEQAAPPSAPPSAARTAARTAASSAPALAPASAPLHAPATFTRHGERMLAPVTRHRDETRAKRIFMSGAVSPKPVRTAAGLWRVPAAHAAALADDDEDDDDDDDDVVDVVAWSTLPLDPPASAWAPSGGADQAPSVCESDAEEDDFHQTMLNDAELDMLARADVASPGSEVSDGGALTDGHVTTPASCEKESSPGDLPPHSGRASMRSTQSPSHAGDGSAVDSVFAHALPVPCDRGSEQAAHAGLLTLSLPYDLLAKPGAERTWAHGDATEPVASDLDTDGDLPLTPMHMLAAAELAGRVDAPDASDDGARKLSALAAASLPSDLSAEERRVSAGCALRPTSPLRQHASPLSSPPADRTPFLDDTCASPTLFSADSPPESATPPLGPCGDASVAWLDGDALQPQLATTLCLHFGMAQMRRPSDTDDSDTLFSPPETTIPLTDLDLAWGCGPAADASSSSDTKCATPAGRAPARARPRARHLPPASCTRTTRSDARARVPRLRSRS
ncbi:hypothetical protein MSPP1_002388 [Malassezia sp. CBS 17886]|nr:hypothetical protein MSPP1_002388 [Malassezia sp. CBS 17886]